MAQPGIRPASKSSGRRNCLTLENSVNRRLGALLTVRARHAHRADYLAVDHDGKAPGCGKSRMKVGARFSPVRTILLVSDVGRRQRSADLAFSRAVSIAFAAAPSMACDSIKLPPQS